MRPPPCFDDPETRKRIQQVCDQNAIDMNLLTDLCEVVQSYSGSGRKEGVTADLTLCFDNFLARSNGKE